MIPFINTVKMTNKNANNDDGTVVVDVAYALEIFEIEFSHDDDTLVMNFDL